MTKQRPGNAVNTLHEEQEKVNYLSEYGAREMDVTIPRLNGEVVVATIKLSVKEKTVAQ